MKSVIYFHKSLLEKCFNRMKERSDDDFNYSSLEKKLTSRKWFKSHIDLITKYVSERKVPSLISETVLPLNKQRLAHNHGD